MTKLNAKFMNLESNFNNEEFAGWKAPDSNNQLEIPPEKKEEKRSKLKEIMNSPTGRWIRKITLYTWIGLAAAGAVGMGRSYLKMSKEAEKISAQMPENKENEKKYQENLQFVESKVGEGVLMDIAKAQYRYQKNLQSIPKQPKINGSSKIGLSDSAIKQLWKDGETYPKGWINGQVSEINFHHKLSSLPKGADASYGQLLKDINVLARNGQPNEELNAGDWLFSHELGHNNSYKEKVEATYPERVNLLANLLKLMEDKKVDLLSEREALKKIKDPQKRLMADAEETWATMCEYYFTFPEVFKREQPESYRLVDQWVKESDSTFDPSTAKLKRDHIIDSITQPEKQ